MVALSILTHERSACKHTISRKQKESQLWFEEMGPVEIYEHESGPVYMCKFPASLHTPVSHVNHCSHLSQNSNVTMLH